MGSDYLTGKDRKRSFDALPLNIDIKAVR